MLTREPVAITGIGMICPLGIAARECWERMIQGVSGIQRITRFESSGCETCIGGSLPEDYLVLEKERTPKRLFKQTIRVTRLLRICAQDALADSGVDRASIDPRRAAVIFGTSGGSVRAPEDLGDKDVERFRIIREMPNASAAWVSIDCGFRGPSYVVSAASASGAIAVVKSMELIASGFADLVLTGGADILLSRNSLRRGNLFQLLSRRNHDPKGASRPFDGQRDGWVLSDGGCVLVLESRTHALSRGAPVYAWLRGCGFGSSPYRAFAPRRFQGAMAKTMGMALSNAAIPASSVEVICASGTSGIVEDFCETAAIKEIFGKHAERLWVSAHKSMIGHTIGGSGPIALAVSALSLRERKIPPTINQENADAACDLNYVPNRMMDPPELEWELVNAFDLGGHHCSFVMSRTLETTVNLE